MADTINVIDWEGAKKMSLAEFIKLADPNKRAALVERMTSRHDMVDGIVCYQNEDGRSRQYGTRYFVTFGPGPSCESLTVEPLLGVLHLGSGAIAYCEKESKST